MCLNKHIGIYRLFSCSVLKKKRQIPVKAGFGAFFLNSEMEWNYFKPIFLRMLFGMAFL